MANRKRTFLDYYFGPWLLRVLGVEYPERPTLEVVGEGGITVSASDQPGTDATRLTISGGDGDCDEPAELHQVEHHWKDGECTESPGAPRTTVTSVRWPQVSIAYSDGASSELLSIEFPIPDGGSTFTQYRLDITLHGLVLDAGVAQHPIFAQASVVFWQGGTAGTLYLPPDAVTVTELYPSVGESGLAVTLSDGVSTDGTDENDTLMLRVDPTPAVGSSEGDGARFNVITQLTRTTNMVPA
jgi:hypothetical protein